MIDLEAVRADTPGVAHCVHLNNAGAGLMPRAGRSPAAAQRQRVAGRAEVAAALERADPVRCVVVPRGACPPEVEAVLARAEAAGVRVERVGARKFERLRGNQSAARVLALVGPDPKADLDSVMRLGGAVWLLTGPAYPATWASPSAPPR